MLCTSPPLTLISKPQQASQKGQMRWCVVVGVDVMVSVK
jgi:hypothetical protein